MIYLIDKTCGKSYLVTVAAVSMCGGSDNLALRKFAGQSLVQRLGRVGGAGDTHSLIDVCTSRKWVADATAKTGGGTTEGFNLSRMVVSLVFEIYEPLLLVAVNDHRHHDGAGVDLVRGLLVVEDASLLEAFAGKGSDIHQTDKLIRTSGVVLLVVGKVLFESALNKGFVVTIVKLDIIQLSGEGGVTAVVAPVGVEHTYLCHCRVAVLLVVEVTLYMLEVGESHSQSERTIKFLQFVGRHVLESVEHDDIGRLVEMVDKRFWFNLVGETTVDGIDAMLLYLGLLSFGQCTSDNVCRG